MLETTTHQKLAQRLWQSLFKTLRSVIASLCSFQFESSIEDEHNETYREFVEKITTLIETIEDKCPPRFFQGANSETAETLGRNLEWTLIELKVQRGEIYHGSVVQVSPSRFCEIFGVAQQRLLHCAKELEKSFEAFLNEMIESSEQENAAAGTDPDSEQQSAK